MLPGTHEKSGDAGSLLTGDLFVRWCPSMHAIAVHPIVLPSSLHVQVLHLHKLTILKS